MKSINKARQAEIEVAMEGLGEAAKELETVVENYNDELTGLSAVIEEAQRKYNDAIRDVKELYEGIALEASDYYDERSEKWQEGEAGVEYKSWVDQLEEFADQFEEVEVELAEQLDVDIIDTEQLEFPADRPGDQ